MSITKTVITVASSGERFELPVPFTEAEVRQHYSSGIPGLANMQATVTEANGTRTIAFSPRQGSKG